MSPKAASSHPTSSPFLTVWGGPFTFWQGTSAFPAHSASSGTVWIFAAAHSKHQNLTKNCPAHRAHSAINGDDLNIEQKVSWPPLVGRLPAPSLHQGIPKGIHQHNPQTDSGAQAQLVTNCQAKTDLPLQRVFTTQESCTAAFQGKKHPLAFVLSLNAAYKLNLDFGLMTLSCTRETVRET